MGNMMGISAALVKQLRVKTGVGMMKCKQALQEANGDVSAAEVLLRKQGASSAAKKSTRATGEGMITSYIHTGGKIGVLLEVNCETDFAARSEGFLSLVHELSMHIAAAAPQYVDAEQVPQAQIDQEKEIARDQAEKSGKPDNVVEKIVEGKLKKFYGEICLLDQAYVKDSDVSVRQLVESTVGVIGENIKIKRFVRFVLGEAD
jgi:elongation factor Ts